MRRLKNLSERPRTSGLLAGCLAGVALLATASAASAVTYRPTRTDDPAPNGCKKKDCSLREAVIAANASGTPATILLRPGKRYELTRPGLGEDAAVTGDLDLTSQLAVETKGFVGRSKNKRHRGARAVIDGNDIDRIFDVHGPGLRLDGIVARDGHARMSAGDDGDGGAIRGGFLKIHNSRLIGNVAAGNGGAFTAITTSPFNVAMSMSLLKGNSAAGNGGAVYVSGSPGRLLEINGVRSVRNSAGGSGGAFFGTGLGIDGSTVADNQAGADGGGIAFSGTGSNFVSGSTVSGNRAASSGGGVHTTAAPASGALPGVVGFGMRDSTVANNRAGGNGGGVGAAGGSSTTELDADTVARNLAGPGHVGGGLYQGSGDAIRAQNTIVALNLVGAGGTGLDCFGASSGFDSLGHNLIGNADGCSGFGAAGDLFGGRLALGKLADNGGEKHGTYGRPLQTIALGRGSRAIDHAVSSIAADERGVIRNDRPQDIGAYERVVKSYSFVNEGRVIRCTRTDPICAK